MSIEDKLYGLLKVYKKLPYPIKNVIGKGYKLLPNKIKYGNFYFSYLNRINRNLEDFDFLLEKQLKLMVDKIPYYKNKNYKGILDFPIIDKTIIRNNFESFLNPSNTNLIKTNTGGSSGTPFEFYLEKGISRPKEKAHFDWYWSQFGYKPDSRVLMIRGEALADNKLYEFQAIENKLAISCYLINSTNINEVIKVVDNFKPEYIHAYPSALKNFINSIDNSGCKEINLNIKAIFLGSEGLYTRDRNHIESYFNCKVAHWYGHSERLIHAGSCPYSNEFHIFAFYGYTELIDENMEVITQPNKKGRIVATGYDNDVMPLVRYDTGDEAEYSEIKECRCGFQGRSFKKIYGRKQDYIYLNDKTKVSLTAFIFGQHLDEFEVIREIQIEQEKYGNIIVRVVLFNSSKIDSLSFIKKLKESVNNKLKIELSIVDVIPKTIRGKHIFLIQKIKD